MVRGTLFDVMYVTSEYSKVACVVAKKTLPRAVDRNRIKRRIYSLYKKLRPTKACIMVIYPKKQALRISHKVLQDEMKGIFATL
jgi:ribonuclease P protein component